ncbi:MAG: alpha/beta hydrolase [Acidobacteria bacterium]|nr:alpha/beta hydrolase [Acidobacteriota bacterium]
MNRLAHSFAVIFSSLLLSLVLRAQINPDSSTFDADGTAHITRMVPIPSTVSPEAQAWLKEIEHQAPQPGDLAEIRARTDAWRKTNSAEARRLYPVDLQETSIAGVRTDIITPLFTPQKNKDLVLINFHGGGFISDSGSLIEGVPIAHLAKMKVVSVYYRLAPENPFPAAVDDGVAVYRELLKTYQPNNVGIFGTSAGATLTGEVAVKIKQLRLPLPGALGMFSTHPDFSRPTDSQQLFALNGLAGNIAPRDPNRPVEDRYAGKTDPKDPVLSPLFADLQGMPATLLVTSTRDLLLSDTSMFHLALLRAGVNAQLVVFEALPHAFWYHFGLPETKDALQLMAGFFERNLGR